VFPPSLIYGSVTLSIAETLSRCLTNLKCFRRGINCNLIWGTASQVPRVPEESHKRTCKNSWSSWRDLNPESPLTKQVYCALCVLDTNMKLLQLYRKVQWRALWVAYLLVLHSEGSVHWLALLGLSVVTISTSRFNFKIYTFCPHSVFTCFVWISEQTANISLYNINWLVLIAETESVYCAVRGECLDLILVNLGL